MDSDGDGLSNGEELGDPGCTWKAGDKSPSTEAKISHPGVCDVNPTRCGDKYLKC